jgi:hypothetical protein
MLMAENCFCFSSRGAGLIIVDHLGLEGATRLRFSCCSFWDKNMLLSKSRRNRSERASFSFAMWRQGRHICWC